MERVIDITSSTDDLGECTVHSACIDSAGLWCLRGVITSIPGANFVYDVSSQTYTATSEEPVEDAILPAIGIALASYKHIKIIHNGKDVTKSLGVV